VNKRDEEVASRKPAGAVVLALLTAGLVTAYLWHVQRSAERFHGDLDVQLAAVRYLLAERNPYPLIGPGREFNWPATLYHPLPTLIVLAPLGALSLPTARLVFVGLTCFAYVAALLLTPGPRWRLLALLSKCSQAAALQVQWSYLLCAAWLLPALGVFAAVKPNIGAAIIGARLQSKWFVASLVGFVVLTSASFVVQPTWPRDWMAALATDPNRRAAVLVPWGFFLALSVVKWRRPEARLLFMLSVIPQTLGMYDALLLFFIPKRASECIALVALSHFSYLMVFSQPGTLNERVIFGGTAVVYYLYLPCLAMVLRRPNAGTVPAWLDRITVAFPSWLRGTPT
jgi:hypothetical protein